MRLLSNYMRVFTQSCEIDDDKNDILHSLVTNVNQRNLGELKASVTFFGYIQF